MHPGDALVISKLTGMQLDISDYPRRSKTNPAQHTQPLRRVFLAVEPLVIHHLFAIKCPALYDLIVHLPLAHRIDISSCQLHLQVVSRIGLVYHRALKAATMHISISRLKLSPRERIGNRADIEHADLIVIEWPRGLIGNAADHRAQKDRCFDHIAGGDVVGDRDDIVHGEIHAHLIDFPVVVVKQIGASEILRDVDRVLSGLFVGIYKVFVLGILCLC